MTKMRMRVAFLNVILIFLVILSASCRVEKRIYRKGYHVVWNHSKVKSESRTVTHKVNNEIVKNEASELLTANNNSDEIVIANVHKQQLILDNDSCGDVLLLQNADEIRVKILEIDDNNIKYKRCDNFNGPTYTIAKNKVALIKYANGIKEVIQQDAPVSTPIPQQKKYNQPAKINMLGLVSLIGHIGISILSSGVTGTVTTGFGLAGFLALGFLATLVIAYVALFQFRAEPEKYTGKWMPLTVIGLDLTAILILTLLLISFGRFFSVALGPLVAILLVIFAILLGLLILGLSPKPKPPKFTDEK